MINKEHIIRLEQLNEKLRSQGISEESYHLLGLFGSSNDEEKISLNIRRGKHSVVFETYYKERGEKHSIVEFNDLEEACEYLFRKLENSKAVEGKLSQK